MGRYEDTLEKNLPRDDWYIQNCSVPVILRRARKDEADEVTRGKFSVSRGNPCVLENDKILNLPIEFIHSCSHPRLSRFTLIDESGFHLNVPCAIPIAPKRINPPRNSFARTAGTLSPVLLKAASLVRVWNSTVPSGDWYNFLFPTITILLNTPVVVHRLNLERSTNLLPLHFRAQS